PFSNSVAPRRLPSSPASTRSYHSRIPASSYVLSMLSIGAAWRTCSNPSIGSPPTRCVGLSGSSSSRCSFSSPSNSPTHLSHPRQHFVKRRIAHDRAAPHLVRPIRPLQQLPQLMHQFSRLLRAHEPILPVSLPRCFAVSL